MTALWSVALALVLTPPLADLPVDATKLAVKLTTEGAANFDRKDSKTLAESYNRRHKGF